MRLALVNHLFQTVVRRITQSISYLLGPLYIKHPQKIQLQECQKWQGSSRNGMDFPNALKRSKAGTHIGIKKPLENAANYFERKETYTMSIQACADFKYCFFDVVIRWPGSVNDAGVFSNSA